MLLGPNIEEQVREEERLRLKAEQEAKDRRNAEEAQKQRQAARRKSDAAFWNGLGITVLILLGIGAAGGLIAVVVAFAPKSSDATGAQNAAPAFTPAPAPQKRTEAATPSYPAIAPPQVSSLVWDDRREDRTSVKTPCGAAREEKQQAPEPKKTLPEARPYAPPPRSVPTTIQVHMPADADLYANGVLLPGQRGQTERTFAVPDRPEGSDQHYYFTVRDRDGRTQQQVVGFQAGESKSVDLGGVPVRPPPIPYRP